jgi:ribosomal protein L37AE/L43A
MDKYGVEEVDPEKTASKDEKERCPSCDTELPDKQETGGTRICDECGTKPFEKK